MYRYINRAGATFPYAMFKYYKPLVNQEQIQTKLKEVLIAERMKPSICAAIPEIQIGGKSEHLSPEHIALIKTWMLDIEENNGQGIMVKESGPSIH